MVDQRETVDAEAAARSAWEPGQRRRSPDDPILNASNPTEHRSEQSHIHSTHQSTPSDVTALANAASRRRSTSTTGSTSLDASTEVEVDIPRTVSSNGSSTGSGYLGMLARTLGIVSGSGQGSSTDPAVLVRRIEKLRKNDASMQRELKSRHNRIVQLEHDNDRLQRKLHQAAQEIQNNHHQYEEAIASFKAELKQSDARTATLRRKVAEDEAKLSKAYTAAVSTFAEEVSRDLPDDVIRNDFNTFFQGDFFSWCADMCTPQIAQQEQIIQHLRSISIINSAETYLASPEHLQFDMNLSDGSSPLVLLQAALAKTLCDAFLKSPFFLSSQQEAFELFLEELSRVAEAAALDWRVQTVASLEAIVPFDSATSANHAREFETSFGFLLKELDEESREDLCKLFNDFAHLALKIWKIRTNIAVFMMSDFANADFKLGSKHMDGEPTTVASLGQKLEGRPIGAVMRPLIVSELVMPEDGRSHQVVWSKALVWVSPHG